MSDEIEEKALNMGWVPQEEFKGDPEKWRPAEEWIERGENYIPILRAENKKLREDLELSMKAVKAKLEKMEKQGYDRAKAVYESKIKELEEKKKEAFETQDLEQYDRVQKEINAIEKPPEKHPESVVNPVFEDWNKKNPWYAPNIETPGEADIELTYLANAIAGEFTSKTPGVSPEQLYEHVEKRVRELRPDKFTNPRREKADIGESGGAKPVKGGKKTLSDVPKEAKDAYQRQKERFARQGIEFTKEEYMNDYFEE